MIAFNCPGLLDGEIIIALEDGAQSIVALMVATNPDLEYITSIFDEVIANFFRDILLLVAIMDFY